MKWEIDLLPEGGIGVRVNGSPGAADDLKLHCPQPIRYLKEYDAYKLPRVWEACTGARKAAEKHGAELEIGPDLAKWAREEKARLASVPSVNSVELVELERVSRETPRLAKAMSDRPFQTVGTLFAARNKVALIADEPGLGKTLQSIGAVVEAGVTGAILVVAPKSAVYDTWPRELALWAPQDAVLILGGEQTKSERNKIAKAAHTLSAGKGRTWVLTQPNYLRVKAVTDEYGKYVYGPGKVKQYKPVNEAVPELFDVPWGAVIVDESHRTLAVGSGNAKKFSAQRQGMDMLSVREGGLRIALSGTPFRGKREYAYGTLTWLRPDLYTSFWRWVNKHFDISDNGYGKTIGGLKNEGAFYAELSRVMIRRTKAEVAQDLPPKAYAGTPLVPGDPKSPVAVWLSMGKAQAKVYDQMAGKAMAELESGDLLANGILAIMTRLKQFACSTADLVGDDVVQPHLPSNKFEWLVEWLDERGLDKDTTDYAAIPKVIVASQFSKLLTLFSKELAALGIESHLFTGGTSSKDREKIIHDFQHNPNSRARVLLLTITAGGVSLTLDAADDVILLDETWVPDDTTQLEDRAHRLSRTDHNVTIWKLKTLGSIEEGIAKTLQTRDDNIRAVIDGARGVETARVLIGG